MPIPSKRNRPSKGDRWMNVREIDIVIYTLLLIYQAKIEGFIQIREKVFP